MGKGEASAREYDPGCHCGTMSSNLPGPSAECTEGLPELPVTSDPPSVEGCLGWRC